MPDPVQVESMFARIAGVYDLLNRTLSLGIDQRWRKRMLAASGEVRGRDVLDVCCGTGDVALLYSRHGARVVGVDFTAPMLERAVKKAGRAGLDTRFARGDAMQLPAATASCDVATIAFGIRNVADRMGALRELVRVARPGGRVIVLEFSMPPGALLGRLYRFYFTRLLPFIGRMVSKDREAYEYLPRTVLAWPAPEQFASEMRAAGLEQVEWTLLTRGIACLHVGRVPAGAHKGA
jgi:demethylmenaquinone methyltransferase/2-methoxy-6-polyprenyl-1,4-benzoquinol methylase